MTRVGAAFACIVRSLALAALWFALGAGAATASPPEIFTSLEQPPTTEDVRAAVARGVTIFEFDLETPGSQAAIAAVKQAKGSVTAYHIGGGGGRDWGSVRTGEWVRRYDSPRDFLLDHQAGRGHRLRPRQRDAELAFVLVKANFHQIK